MRRLRSFLERPPVERALLRSALLWLGAIRLGLWLLPFRVVRAMLAWLAHGWGGGRRDRRSARRTAWAVAVASRYVPRSTCLARALAVQLLLEREGLPAELRIGVARGPDGRLRAHAWVESEGDVVIGDEERRWYSPLTALEAAAR